MERMILAKTKGSIATLANVAGTWNKTISKHRQLNLRPSASLLMRRKTNGRRAMYNRFLKRALFLTVALTGGIVGSVYSSMHRTHVLGKPAPRIQDPPSFTNQPVQPVHEHVYLRLRRSLCRLPTQREMATDNGGIPTVKL
jgi:hypothetical protein